jgi:hypothetical protein
MYIGGFFDRRLFQPEAFLLFGSEAFSPTFSETVKLEGSIAISKPSKLLGRRSCAIGT